MKNIFGEKQQQAQKRTIKSTMLLGASILALGSTAQNITMFAASVAGMSLISSQAFAGGYGDVSGPGTGFAGGGGADAGIGGDGGPSVTTCDGTQSRTVQCLDFRGNVVADAHCLNGIDGMKPVSTRRCDTECPEIDRGGGDPLVFDLDGNGISLVSAEDGVMFDIDNDGETNQTGWVDSTDGLLALDANGNGIIDDQSELFGSEITGAYNSLAEFDFNDDGVIDGNDTVWDQLTMWVDANSDGVTDDGELKTMADLGMESIDLTYETVDQVNAGNKVTGVGTFTRIVNGAEKVVNKVIETFFDFIV